jgi:hypothetical protein
LTAPDETTGTTMSIAALVPIETVFDGHRFRSRTEARWAVFFHYIGWKYEYEKKGFNLDGLNYLPNFWLPEIDCWFEIKGEAPTDREITLMSRLVFKSKRQGFIAIGAPQSGEHQLNWFRPSLAETWHSKFSDDWAAAYVGLNCGPKQPATFRLSVSTQRNLCLFAQGFDYGFLLGSGQIETAFLEAAYFKATGARFEYGETPREPAVPAI